MSAALERILADVKPPPPPVPAWSAQQQEQQAAFNTANAAAHPAVYFCPGLFQDLALLYHALQDAISASAPPPVDPKKGQLPNKNSLLQLFLALCKLKP